MVKSFSPTSVSQIPRFPLERPQCYLVCPSRDVLYMDNKLCLCVYVYTLFLKDKW